jgi:uncharacterized protein YerC
MSKSAIIAERIKSGPRKGSGFSDAQLLDWHDNIVRLLKEGKSTQLITRATGKSLSTVDRVRCAMKAVHPDHKPPAKYPRIEALLKAGWRIVDVVAETGKCVNTVRKVKKSMADAKTKPQQPDS